MDYLSKLPSQLLRILRRVSDRLAGRQSPNAFVDRVFLSGDHLVCFGWSDAGEIALEHRGAFGRLQTDTPRRFHRADLVRQCGPGNLNGFVAMTPLTTHQSASAPTSRVATRVLINGRPRRVDLRTLDHADEHLLASATGPAPATTTETHRDSGTARSRSNCAIDSASIIDTWILVQGWSSDPGHVLAVGNQQVRLSPDAERVFWYRREDVDLSLKVVPGSKHGFIALLPFMATPGTPLPEARITSNGHSLSITSVGVGPEDSVARAALVLGSSTSAPDLEDRFAKLGVPYADSVDQRAPRWSVSFDSTQQQDPIPHLSVVVPFYGNEHFLDLHAASIGALEHASRSAVELVVVNDKPSSNMRNLAAALSMLHGLRVKMVHSDRNHGFARAVMGGARAATGDYLLVLNSDCFFDDFSVVHRLTDSLAAQPSLGAVAPLLLREDGSVDHLGMRRVRVEGRSPDFFVHLGAGHPRSSLPEQTLLNARYVTGACLAFRRSEFIDRYHGFPTFSLIGDFEDAGISDLIVAQGQQLAIDTTVTATHFVRTSFHQLADPGPRDVLSWFNAWRYQRWVASNPQISASVETLNREGEQP